MVVAPFLMKYVVGEPGAIGSIFAFYVGSSLLSLPIWLAISRRIGKKWAWMIGLVIGMAGYVALFFVERGEVGAAVGAPVPAQAASVAKGHDEAAGIILRIGRVGIASVPDARGQRTDAIVVQCSGVQFG